MGLLDGLELNNKSYPCKVRRIAETLSKEDAKVFLDAVSNPDWPITTLAEQLRNRGVDISPSPITKHRKGLCSC